ncbi:hypothetical protein GEV33_002308 [Tenebrio molitor]|uniref:Regulatory protein zeste n=1 Tax=Tenebrio molitor TaxID=7067 RepID=A0A8J6HUN2_TENMO|nr:hypothetical protein GEV33_002308 [Tenebrio molitor]
MSSKPKRIRAGALCCVGEQNRGSEHFKKKRKLWEELAEKMRKAGHIRSPSKLRDNYFRMKQAAKTSITQFKKEQRKTGGGPGPSESETPSDMDWAIHNVCPIDFEEDVSAFDSDNFRDLPSSSFSIKPESIGLIDPTTGLIENSETQNNATTKKPKGKKRRHEMSAFAEEMLQLHKAHLEARIDNERRINEKEMEILKTKHEVELQKLEILKKKSVWEP